MTKTAKETQVALAAADPILLVEAISRISPADLFVAPWNARKTLDEAALVELTESIKRHGLQVPLLVRPLTAGNKIVPHPKYEIVAGHRRFEAMKRLGFDKVSCIVRTLFDEEAQVIGLVENLQREELPPMEEAEAYGKALSRPGVTIEAVAAVVGKSASYVGRRAQLLKAIEPVRQALKAGAIEVGHALELARLTEAMQTGLLEQLDVGGDIGPNEVVDEVGEPGTCRFCSCTEDKPCPGGCGWANEEETICDTPKCLAKFRAELGECGKRGFRKTSTSVVELRNRIERQSLRILTEAPFRLDAALAPMPCTDCPKRSSNAALLFDDCAQDTCTDRRCFDAKVQAWIQVELDAAKREKRKLLQLVPHWTSDKKKVEVNEYSHSGPKLFKSSEQECQHGEEGIWIEGGQVGHRATICRNANCKTHRGSSSSSSSYEKPEKTAKQKEDRSKVLVKVKDVKAYRTALVAVIANCSTLTAKTVDALLIDVCCALIANMNSQYEALLAKAIGWDEKSLGWSGRTKLRAKIAELPVAKRLLIARLSEEAGELSVSEYNVNGKCEDLEKIAHLVGVDPKKIRAAAAAAPAKTAKPAPAQVVKPKKSVLTAAAKKRIAEAQRKRWAGLKKKGGRK